MGKDQNFMLTAVVVFLVLVIAYMYRADIKRMTGQSGEYETPGSCDCKEGDEKCDCPAKTTENYSELNPKSLPRYVEKLSNDDDYQYDPTSTGGYDPYPEVLDEDDVDYDNWRKEVSLEDKVYRNHHQFTEDIARTSKGAGNTTVIENPDPVTWVGIKRPAYHRVTENDDARQVTGWLPDNYPYKNTSFRV